MKKEDNKIAWTTVILIATFHVLAIIGLQFITWRLFLLSVTVWAIGSLSLAVGYHRLVTHRGFVTKKLVEYWLVFCAMLTVQGSPVYWVAIHRRHHELTDQPGDPHSPRDGFAWAHILWFLYTDRSQSRQEITQHYAPDLLKQRFYRLVNVTWWVPSTIFGLTLWLLLGYRAMFWGVFIPVTVTFHFTWFVNSVCHKWGSRRFDTPDDSTNNWWVALVSGGEGWHNNHHAFPSRARHGLRKREIDFSWYFIQLLQFLGLARNVKV